GQTTEKRAGEGLRDGPDSIRTLHSGGGWSVLNRSFLQDRTVKIGTLEHRATQVCNSQPGPDEYRGRQIGTQQSRTAEIGIGKIGRKRPPGRMSLRILDLNDAESGAEEARARSFCGRQICTVENGIGEIRILQ